MIAVIALTCRTLPVCAVTDFIAVDEWKCIQCAAFTSDQDDRMRIQGNPQSRFFQLALCCTLLVLTCAATAQAQDGTEKLSVVEVSGAVKVKLDNRWAS